jgi:hypothetical protein
MQGLRASACAWHCRLSSVVSWAAPVPGVVPSEGQLGCVWA